MALNCDDNLIRAWLLIKTEVTIDTNNWEAITSAIRKSPGVIRADWISSDTYDLVVPVVVRDERVLNQLIDQIEGLEINPKIVEILESGSVKGHNPPPGDYEPDKHNEWG